ncbi:MAG: protein-export chaperone SecB [Gammaproteobacteria bacterium]|nr:protein-export chaperone SecB [Gammaproteobacteria bacterium]
MSDEASQEKLQQFAIQKIYIKDVSFETPNSPQIFTEKKQPEINVDLNTSVNVLNEGDIYEVVLRITVTAKIDENTAFLAEVHQAGIFNITGFEKPNLDAMLGSYCPNLLFPFAREAISDLVTKGGFPQLLLQPVNFDAMYAQHIQQQKAAVQPDEVNKDLH